MTLQNKHAMLLRQERPGGILLYVMGPSGAGKDSLISHARSVLCDDYNNGRAIRFARRYITRASEAPGEEHYPVSYEGFLALKNVGEFCMDWQSHGLRYGVSRELARWLEHGDLAVVNGSREYLPFAEARFNCLVPLMITVKPQVLRHRLQNRGRESASEIKERLEKACLPLKSKSEAIRLDNSGSLATAQAEFIEILRGLAGMAAPDRQYRENNSMIAAR